MIKIEPIIYKPLLVNTYIVYEVESRHALVIDPAGSHISVVELLTGLDLNLKMILYTHLHLDHIAGGRDLAEEIPVPAYAHESDLFLFEGIEQVAHFLKYPPVSAPAIDSFLNQGDVFELGDTEIEVLHTPGHTPGACSFVIENNVFSGDTLFREGIGRTDLPGGNEKDIMNSIKNKLLVLPDPYILRPGHGEYSTIGHEKKHNPFLK